MKRNALLLIVAAGVLVVAARPLTPPASPGSRELTAACRVGIDYNGQFTHQVPTADAAELEKALDGMVSTSAAGLVEVPSPAAAGGTMMDVRGRFQSAAVVRVGSDGKPVVPCVGNEADVKAVTTARESGE